MKLDAYHVTMYSCLIVGIILIAFGCATLRDPRSVSGGAASRAFIAWGFVLLLFTVAFAFKGGG